MEMVIILALAFGAMWLMTSRTRKQQREAADFRANLEVGQEVMTGSGLYGTIVDIDGDTITLESTPGNETRWIRAAIARLAPPADDLVEDEADLEEYEDDAEYDEAADGEWQGTEGDEPDDDRHRDVPGAAPHTQHSGSSRLDRIDVPDDLSTIDERRTDDTDRR